MTSNKIGFIYPGQGAQQVGMGADLVTRYADAEKRFAEADAVVGFSLKNLCLEGPQETLNQDLNAQLAIYTISAIVTDILRNQGVVADICTGYSSGFYAAAYAAGCFDFQTGLSVVKKAGEFLLTSGQAFDGGMAVIFGLSGEQVHAILDEIGNVDVAIQNTPRQIVVSGSKPDIESAMLAAMHEGALDAHWIPAATAYHSRFMTDAGQSLLASIIDTPIHRPKRPLYSYATTEQIMDRKALIQAMVMQLSHTVLWVDLIRKLRHNQVQVLVETGPGTLLSRSVHWIDRHLVVLNTTSADSIQHVAQTLSPSTISGSGKVQDHHP